MNYLILHYAILTPVKSIFGQNTLETFGDFPVGSSTYGFTHAKVKNSIFDQRSRVLKWYRYHSE